MANKRIIELQERTSIDMGDWLIVDSSTSTRKLSLATLFNYMTYSSMIFVTELPTTDISTTTIYLMPHSGSTTDWDEYIYRENEWVLIGTSTIDLSAIYQTKTDNNLQTTSKQIVGAINEVNSDINKYHRRVAYYMNTTNKTYAQCLTEICDQLDALQLDDEQIANLCLEAGLESSSFNLYRCVRHNKANGYYCFVGLSAGASTSLIYSGRTTASGVASTVNEHTMATGTNNDISSATNSTEWRVYV